MYADETGNLDYEGDGKEGASPYFGFGTAVFDHDHGSELWEGLLLRADLESRGLNLPKGFHAINDSNHTRGDMFELIKQQAPRIDTTFLCKANAYDYVKQRGQMYLYKMAWFQHFKYVAPRVATAEDRLFVIAGSFGTKSRQTQARLALADVCDQMRMNIVLCIWDASSSWGLQVADYALWAVHRNLLGRPCYWYEESVLPTLHSTFKPWGRAPEA
nr:DUF3800 domain-containing protein [Cellulomonas hominis]